jgi:hypothetical protein
LNEGILQKKVLIGQGVGPGDLNNEVGYPVHRDFRVLTCQVLALGQRTPTSRYMAKYWQGNRPPDRLGYALDT